MLGLVFRGHHRKVRVFFSASDILLIALGFLLAYIARQHLRFENNFYLEPSAIALLLGWAMLMWVALGYWWEIYDRIDAAHPRVILRDAFRQCLLGIVLMVLLQYVEHRDLSRSFVALFAGITWCLLCLFRLNAGRLLGAMRGRFGVPHFVMVVGLGDPARRLARQIEDAAIYGIRLTGFLAEAPGRPAVAEIELDGTYPVHALETLPELLRKHVIDEIIFAVDTRQLAELEEVMLACDEEGVRTRVSVDFFPHVNSQIYLDRLGGSPLLTFSATPHDEIRLLMKRALDIVLAGAALVLFVVPMLLIAAIIRLTSPGPVIFRQERCGLNGRRFVCYKLRSMCENAEAMRASLAHLSQRELALKIPNDPRLTSVGRWLRKFSLDETPQLWNVLKGDMSLVGPRPAIPEEVAQYQRWQRRRLRMRPGLTCLWAVSGRDSVDFETWMRLDMQYIDNWSLALDWKIMLRTIPQVLGGRGAH
ncbi:MAG TPA: sugar transferase [Bryobacteraceae bacterium]|jgi:exopolysaccharide biosynthesis polyprenyl glycosylphosphotransferase